MRELVVISGKGGTGKTSIVASFAVLAKRAVLADCDVDAADLHLILEPTIVKREEFSGGSRAQINSDRCGACGKCQSICRFDAVSFDGPSNGIVEKTFRIDPIACDGCGVCAYFCPQKAIEFAPAVNGEWFISDSRCGPMVHARLGVAEENSGKLVSLVRMEARKIAANQGLDLVLLDGAPGISCPVIASLTGASLVLVVTEPTLSGEHDLERVLSLTRHFGIPTVVCVNKWDLNPSMTEEIEHKTRNGNSEVVGRVRYDQCVTTAQIHAMTAVEYECEAGKEIQSLWDNLKSMGAKYGVQL